MGTSRFWASSKAMKVTALWDPYHVTVYDQPPLVCGLKKLRFPPSSRSPSVILTPPLGGSSLLTPVLLLRSLAQLGRPAHFLLLNFPNPLFSTGDSVQTLTPPYAFSDFPACPLYKTTTPLPSSCSTSLLGPSASLSLLCHFRPSSDLSYHFAQVWGLCLLCLRTEPSTGPCTQPALTICFRNENCCCDILYLGFIEKQLQIRSSLFCTELCSHSAVTTAPCRGKTRY